MLSMTVNDFLLSMATVLLIGGIVLCGIGVFILVRRLAGKELSTIAEQTTKLAQKGITEDMTGLVGNARTLIEALNNMVKTTAGIGLLMMIMGFVMMAAAYALVLQIK